MKAFVFSTLILVSQAPAFANQFGTTRFTNDNTTQRLVIDFPYPFVQAGLTSDALLCGLTALPATSIEWNNPSGQSVALSSTPVSNTCLAVQNISLPMEGTYTLYVGGQQIAVDVLPRQPVSPLYVSARSSAGTQAVLQFPTSVVTKATPIAVVCPVTGRKVAKVDLWMWMDHGHGHGSAPTTLSERDDGCTMVSDLDFFMAGKWEVRVKLDNGELITLPLEVR